MLESPTISISKLTAITNLLDALHENDILYCHWKSNEHLGASMMGDTDLDVLFDESQKHKLESILQELGFKRFDSIKERQYKDIVDFMGLDLKSGKVVHLHTHYRLTMGEPYLKGYQLDLEEKILNSRVFDEQFGIYCIKPAFELILLFLRESLKFRNRDMLLMNLINKIEYPQNIIREYNWLKQRTTDSEVLSILKEIFNNYAPVYHLVSGDFNRKQLYKLAPLVKKEFKSKRLYHPWVALALRWYREASVISSRKLGQLLDRPVLTRRVNPRGGISIAVIGADGSGKSTVVGNLKETFEKKIDIYSIYFGRGVGKVSWSRKSLMSLKSLMVPEKHVDNKRNGQNSTDRKKGVIHFGYKCIQALLVAREKSRGIVQMQVAKNKGMLVICDRYPQHQVMGFNDGPLLHHFLNADNPLCRVIAKMEKKIYAKAENNPPDLVFKLIADAEVVEKRKPGETSIETLEQKIEGIKHLRFKGKCKTVVVDASRPLQEVLHIIKKEIWSML